MRRAEKIREPKDGGAKEMGKAQVEGNGKKRFHPIPPTREGTLGIEAEF
jgi:hypothetical protein